MRPHWRRFALSADRSRISWQSVRKKEAKSVMCADIAFVDHNVLNTAVFQRWIAKVRCQRVSAPKKSPKSPKSPMLCWCREAAPLAFILSLIRALALNKTPSPPFSPPSSSVLLPL